MSEKEVDGVDNFLRDLTVKCEYCKHFDERGGMKFCNECIRDRTEDIGEWV